MQRFLEMLIGQFFEITAEHPIAWERTDLLTHAIFHAASQIPDFAHELFSKELIRIRTGVIKDMHRAAGRDFKWPSVHHLCFYRLIGHVFPVTDVRHRVRDSTSSFFFFFFFFGSSHSRVQCENQPMC
jgi:hypothetical protein